MHTRALTIGYCGIEIEWDESESRYCVCFHDGFFSTDVMEGTLTCDRPGGCALHDVENKIMEIIRTYAATHGLKIMAAAIGIVNVELCQRKGEIHVMRKKSWNEFVASLKSSKEEVDAAWESTDKYSADQKYAMEALSIAACPPFMNSEKTRMRLPARLWTELDVLPFMVPTAGSRVNERACQAARKMMSALAPSFVGNIPQMLCGPRHEVEVDWKGMIRLADADDYKHTVCDKRVWKVFNTLATQARSRELRICYFSSTSQGGGVALMRHALIRLLRLVDVEAHWYVAKPNPQVFEITKKKFHNVLQGVAPVGNKLTDDDKALYEAWAKDNAENYWNEGPFRDANVIVIDDPQLSGVIPHIRKVNPEVVLIYRSHIEIRSELVEDPATQAHHNWQYLWQFISQCDFFISHPVPNFVPACIPRQNMLFMGASTDLLDGLNKHMNENDIDFYRVAFNRLSNDQTGKKVDFWNRPYIAQICRFDPSKGLPDVLKAYRSFRKIVNSNIPILSVPQLVIAGTSSVDDPEGTSVFESLLEFLEDEMFDGIRHDVIITRVPPCDQILNTLLSGAWVALQLSIREGFEIKVTEARAKGVPVIAYASGGIPLQVDNGQTGYLVPKGDYVSVADHLARLLHDPELHKVLGENSRTKRNDELFSVGIATNWLAMATSLCKWKDQGGRKKMMELVSQLENRNVSCLWRGMLENDEITAGVKWEGKCSEIEECEG
ncbi:hypothetical protein HDU96_006565 [Phlyctochytrium bullatum]|nr:hypothetical protein HDU96_006565 [Phlyctochytrium bullatum]